MISKLRRATTSVMANIVEGAVRKTTNDFLNFLYNARGYLFECECFLEFAFNLRKKTFETFVAFKIFSAPLTQIYIIVYTTFINV